MNKRKKSSTCIQITYLVPLSIIEQLYSLDEETEQRLSLRERLLDEMNFSSSSKSFRSNSVKILFHSFYCLYCHKIFIYLELNLIFYIILTS